MPPPTAQPAEEAILFQDAPVTVSTMRAIVGPTTYAMANITSVREFVEPKPQAVAVLAFFLFMGSAIFTTIFALIKTKYWVRIGTAGAEANAIYSTDPTWTRKVVAAVNAAIVGRG